MSADSREKQTAGDPKPGPTDGGFSVRLAMASVVASLALGFGVTWPLLKHYYGDEAVLDVSLESLGLEFMKPWVAPLAASLPLSWGLSSSASSSSSYSSLPSTSGTGWAGGNQGGDRQTEPMDDEGCLLYAKSGVCLREPLQMHSNCPGYCEEDKVDTPLRERRLLEDVASQEECALILRLAEAAAILGDGYGGEAHPFSVHERFLGLTPMAAARWAIVQPRADRTAWVDAAVTLYFDIVKRMRKAAEEMFKGQDHELFDDYVHLSCREAEDGAIEALEAEPPLDRYIYADNCFKQGPFECARKKPFFWWRTYTAALFLHSSEKSTDIKGGDFYYSSDWKGSTLALVQPRPGRLALYNAGPANLHGIDLQRQGRSCMLNVFMTDDSKKAAHKSGIEYAEKILSGALQDEELPRSVYMDTFYDVCRSKTLSGLQNRSAEEVATADAAANSVVHHTVRLDGHEMRIHEARENPQISVIENFMSPEEMRHIISQGTPKLKRSTVIQDGELITAKYRSSATAWIYNDNDVDPILTRLDRRISLLTGLDLTAAEDFQLAFYTAGDLGRYEPHMDWGVEGEVVRDFNHIKGAGPRVATFLMYLDNVTDGGHTVFTDLKSPVAVAPKAGTAVFWYNLLSDKSGDALVRHGSCPVVQGHKYIATKWIHEWGNDQLFGLSEKLQRSQRNWEAVGQAAKAAGLEEPRDFLPTWLPEDCQDRVQVGHCQKPRLKKILARSCPGICEEPSQQEDSCGAWRQSGHCFSNPTGMAQHCPGVCEEHLASSNFRGRKVHEGVAGEGQCEAILNICSFLEAGQGYNGNAQPFSKFERFAGATPSKVALQLANLPPETDRSSLAADLRTLLAVAREAQRRTQNWVQELHPDRGNIQLEFDYLQLVCRDTVEDEVLQTASNRPDSHQAHADNCWFDQNGVCRREDPYYHWRSHSAVLFLQSPGPGTFQGGNFYYSLSKDSRGDDADRVLVSPGCGRMVSFAAGPENVHGVTPVTAGRRCALGMWFTDQLDKAMAADEIGKSERLLRELGL